MHLGSIGGCSRHGGSCVFWSAVPQKWNMDSLRWNSSKGRCPFKIDVSAFLPGGTWRDTPGHTCARLCRPAAFSLSPWAGPLVTYLCFIFLI